MDKMQWDDGLSVQVPLIDEQHKSWIEHYNRVVDAVKAHTETDHIIDTLRFLVDYTQFHFETEMKHMTENQYPKMEEHKAIHAELAKTLDNLVLDFREEGATPALAEYVNTFLRNWLTQHIQNVDSQFGAFLKEKGIELPHE